MLWWFVLAAGAVLLLREYLKRTSGTCRCSARLPLHLAVVTGANTGIGLATARDLASRGARVILACRDDARGTAACRLIADQTGNRNVEYRHLDLASLPSVQLFCKELLKTETKLDILMNNAGVGKLKNARTKDGLVMEMTVNHFGPFLLTNLLLPLLKAAPQGRVVNVSSVMHNLGTIDLLTLGEPANGVIAHQRLYSNAKLCNILFTLDLSRRLRGTNVTANSLHPGAVNTDIYRSLSYPLRVLVQFLMPKTCEDGAQTSIHVAVSPDLVGVSGKYFVDCKEETPSRTARDEALARRLWDVSESLVGKYLAADSDRLSPGA